MNAIEAAKRILKVRRTHEAMGGEHLVVVSQALIDCVEVLGFYADKRNNAKRGHLSGGSGPEATGAVWIDDPSDVRVDQGKRARELLEKLRGGANG